MHLLGAGDEPGVVDVLCDAFHAYPVMRFILGPADPTFHQRLPVLVGLFVRARVLRSDPILGVRDAAGRLLGVATLTAPGERAMPPAFADHREQVWRTLGAAERARYEAFAAASDLHRAGEPHYYLNMLGVRGAFAGQGVGRELLDAVHARSAADPHSAGVALSTEDPANVPLYEHVGYRVLGQARVAPELATWSFWRPDAGVSSRDAADRGGPPGGPVP